VNRKAWVLFAVTSIIWGSSFLFIRVAVADMAPSMVVFGRCLLGALFLAPRRPRSASPVAVGASGRRLTQFCDIG
jgi:drug/metabolite transporter (DMT)-like permease